MARGFESKQVESQQEEAQRREETPRQRLSREQAEQLDRRRTLELSRARLIGDLQHATNAAHRSMLEQALSAIDDQIRLLTPRS
jgi:hypothetical protein